jgi:uncharacterized membrane protein YtjA (UPF0391 family)
VDLIVLGVIVLLVSIVLYALGAKGTAGMTAGIGKLILVVGVVIFLILLVVRLIS